jgi:hypothetical protein
MQQQAAEYVVPVGIDVRLDDHVVARTALGRVAATIDARCHVLDAYTPGGAGG